MWHVQGGGEGGTKKHSSWLRPVDGEAKPEQIVEPCDTDDASLVGLSVLDVER